MPLPARSATRLYAVALQIAALSLGVSQSASSQSTPAVRIASGQVRGQASLASGVRTFLGIPYAAPPVGERRWRAPQPVEPWTGVRTTTSFGARCMQAPIYSDMIFRDQVSEDCLYLNVWTPARTASQKLPVMVWIYGGGFQAGSASEPRQDGARLATNGVVVVSLNYRLGVFGFLAHPELTAESKRGTSGNYALLDQLAALQWVHDNIGAFGGDPANVTIFGESAGSFSVSALVASPLSTGLVHKAIGESGAFFGATLGAPTLAVAEQAGVAFGHRHRRDVDRRPPRHQRRFDAHRVARQAGSQLQRHHRRCGAAQARERDLRRRAAAAHSAAGWMELR